MYRFRFVITALCVFLMLFSCKGHTFDFTNPKVLVVSNGDRLSAEVADYFYHHLDKRNLDKTKFIVVRSDDSKNDFEGNRIYFEIVPDLKSDYEIKNEEGRLSIYAKDKSVFRWLSYMLIDRLAENHKLEVSDLPPHYVDFETEQADFAFSYRDPHLNPNMNQDMSGILLTNNVDRDWGIWGHNLKRVFGENPNINSYALVNGKRDKSQYCFSSNYTFEAIKSYIIDQHGFENREPMWFMIAPNDNDLVCTCESCFKAGNTKHNATPAVTDLMNRLGKVFKQDHFYTIGYRTTKEAPVRSLANNSGVLFSTIDLSKAPVLNLKDKEVVSFSNELKAWSKVTSNIYLWDYISNFDEYLVPYPVLNRVKEQLSYFKSLGVKGFFMNGSGYDYSPFDDVKTYALSALMINPDLSITDLVNRYHKRYYPITGELLSSYFLSLENKMLDENLDVYMYSSFREASKSYFDVQKFNTFYDELLKLEPKTKGEEKVKVTKLINALSYVKLQDSYLQGNLTDDFFEKDGDSFRIAGNNDVFVNRLHKAIHEGVINYKEDKGDLSVYLNEWTSLKNRNIPINLLVNAEARSLSSGELLVDLHLLNDNKPGFVSDFHKGWFLSGENFKVMCKLAENHPQKLNLDMTFLINERHRMLAPSKIEVVSDGKLVGQFSSVDFVKGESTVKLKKSINVSNIDKLEIRVFKSVDLNKSVVACDEIFLY